MGVKAWTWTKDRDANGDECWTLFDGRARVRARIWERSGGPDHDRFVWHTFDDNGTGGQNSAAASVSDAKSICIGAIVEQGWAPGGWTVV